MPPPCRAATFGKEAETVVEPGNEVVRPERRGARCRQFKCKRNAVEAPADCRNRRGGLLIRREVWVRLLRPRNEQRHRPVSQHLLQRLRILRRYGERRYAAL